MRTYAREVAFCTVFQYLISGTAECDFSVFDIDKLTDDDRAYVNDTVAFAVENFEKIDKTACELARGYSSERLYKSDRAAIDLAIAEILRGQVPAAVVVNEIIEIVKKYSTEKSSAFVNGVLAAYLTKENGK